MKVMVELPERLLEHPQDAGREILRELSLSAFARGRISRRELREQLGLDRWSRETLLTERGLLPEVTLEEADADAATLARVLSTQSEALKERNMTAQGNALGGSVPPFQGLVLSHGSPPRALPWAV